MVKLSEALRDEAIYQSQFINAKRVRHHDCVAVDATEEWSQIVPTTLIPPKIKFCPHVTPHYDPDGIGIKETRKRTIIRRGFSLWLFEWTDDGISKPLFLIYQGNCQVKNLSEDAYELKSLGWREGMTLARAFNKPGKRDYEAVESS